jgi:thiol-disulfide isomerase/thioredoxin
MTTIRRALTTRFLRLAIFVAIMLAGLSQAAGASGSVPLAVGAPAPAISEPTARGIFDSAASTKPFVVEFFAVWCPHCQREVPVMNELQRVDGNRIDIIAIPASPFAFDKATFLQQADLDQFAERFNTNYRIGFDGLFSSAFDYGLASFPTFYVIGASRHVVAVETGEVPFEKLHADISLALQP